MQLGFFWCGKIRDGGCGKEIFSDDAVPHAHKNLHKSVLLGFGWLGPVLSLYAMTCREEKKQQQVKLFVFLVFFSLSFPSLHETVLGYWIMIHCLYDSPLPIHIIIPWSSFEGNHWERKEKKKKRKSQNPSCPVNWLFFFLPVFLLLAWFSFLFPYTAFLYFHIHNHSKRLYLSALDPVFIPKHSSLIHVHHTNSHTRHL